MCPGVGHWEETNGACSMGLISKQEAESTKSEYGISISAYTPTIRGICTLQIQMINSLNIQYT